MILSWISFLLVLARRRQDGSITEMLIGDTSRQHYSRERTHAGHKSYEGNTTGKQQQNMTLESSTYDFREKEENQTSHTGVELNNHSHVTNALVNIVSSTPHRDVLDKERCL
jgi:hypothetical protein